MSKNSMVKKSLSFVLSFAVMFSVVFMNFGNISLTANAARDEMLTPTGTSTSAYYYIKNVRSGKYLTLENNSTADGTRIVQWHFNAGNNQKWRFEYFGNTGIYGGEYQIVPYNATNKAIQMVSASDTNGVEARLAEKANDTRQFFRINKNYTGSRRFVTNASNFNKVLEINGAVVTDGAKLIHYSQVGNGSDQFLVEPVTYNAEFGVDYAICQNDLRTMAYPNFNKYSDVNDNTKRLYEQTNYVSASICAAGTHYRTSSLYPWYCNKINFFQPSSFTYGELYTNWDISYSWYNPNNFYTEWLNYMNNYDIQNYQDYSYNYVINNNFTIYDIKPITGSIVYVYQQSGNTKNYLFAGYVIYSDSDYNNCIVFYHKDIEGEGKTLYSILNDNYASIQNSIHVTIINPF